uniref:Phosphagen kinase C-terminal domain-containing protein n=1 Tax=Loa loa TaxID=7209 RepID=A0A1I7VK47_LOALO
MIFLRLCFSRPHMCCGNIEQILGRLIKGSIFRLAYFLPSNFEYCKTCIGTLSFPKIDAKSDFTICVELKLRIRGGVYDIANEARLRLMEFEAVKQVHGGVKQLIEMERKAQIRRFLYLTFLTKYDLWSTNVFE